VILGGDVGGTKTALALFEPGHGAPVLVREDTLPSHEFDSLEAAIERFLGAGPRVNVTAACVGVAGPVVDGRCVATNLPWVVDERRLAYSIPAERVRLLNDLEATAHGIFALGEDELVPLQPGRPRRGNIAVIAAGTGLGEAIVVVDGRVRTVVGVEGGHADFGPRGELEEDLLRYLRKEFGHVSYERVLSGPGLLNIYRFLRDTGVAHEAARVAQMMRERDPSAVITELGASQADRLCATALTIFISIYGAEAGNLALKALAVGGVVVAGGIAPRIMPALTAGPFVTSFRDKGRMASLMETIPVSVTLNPKTALLGAARVGRSLMEDPRG
jgi:glucokinase